MKEYLALFRIRFINGLQYRAAALAGLSTQFAWGFMEILAFSAFYRANPAAFPMEFSRLVSYIWIQQAFLHLFAPWGNDAGSSIELIISGDIAYDLARPMDIYSRWFVETTANKIARTALRCLPVLLVAFILPASIRMSLPPSPSQALLFAASVPLSLCVVTAYCMLDCISVFYTMSRQNPIFAIAADFFAGGYIPLPFFPAPLRKIVELTPFAAMNNMPLRIYSGDITGVAAVRGILLQVFWCAALLLLGKLLMRHALGRVVAQGG